MKTNVAVAIAVIVSCLGLSTTLFAHCEIPCGIYDDQMRIKMIAEHITTIEKSIAKINEIEQGSSNNNQLVRWVMNKEDHANQLQEIVTQYFMTQRIKFDTDKYQEKLASLHQLLVHAMKAKQKTDMQTVSDLRKSLETFEKLYFAPH